MKILADKYLYKLNNFLPENVHLYLFDPSDGLPVDVCEYDSLLIRTVTRINSSTLPERGRLQFIGTATAGYDHVDHEYLNKIGIHFATSAGCNANAVGLYVATVLLRWSDVRNHNLRELKVGIVGCGHTGSSVRSHLESLGVKVVCYDPPKEMREPEFRSVDTDELLKCDILTFHTPLTYGENEKYPTRYICSHEWLRSRFKMIINAARGEVVDENALISAKQEGSVEDYILDVWEGEPVFSDSIAQNAFIATPHIAGYSIESKLRASEIVVQQMLRFFQLEVDGIIIQDEKNNEKQDLDNSSVSVNRMASLCKEFEIKELSGRLWELSNIEYYDRELMGLCGLSDHVKAKSFATLRSETKLRSEVI